MYINVDVQNYCLDVVFFVAFVWGCATFAVVFYGVDSVDRNAGVDLNDTKNFQWIHVSQISLCSNHLPFICLILLNRALA